MTATVNRKNGGKQFVCVDNTRFIFHWHRPGEPLPVVLTHLGKQYLLTKELVEAARKSGREKLLKFEPTDYGLVVAPASLQEVNGKGAIVTPAIVIKSKAKAAWAMYGGACALASAGAYGIVKTLEGIAW